MKKLIVLSIALLGLAAFDADARYRRNMACNTCNDCSTGCDTRCESPCATKCDSCPKACVTFSESGCPCCIKRYVFEKKCPANKHMHTSYTCPDGTECMEAEYQPCPVTEVTNQGGSY